MVKVWSDLGNDEKAWLLRPWGPIGQRVLQNDGDQQQTGDERQSIECGEDKRNETMARPRALT
jgi:hypothetical protein